MAIVGQGIPLAWKKAMVPKSPIEQPRRHHAVFCDARRHVRLQRQSMVKLSEVTSTVTPVDSAV